MPKLNWDSCINLKESLDLVEKDRNTGRLLSLLNICVSSDAKGCLSHIAKSQLGKTVMHLTKYEDDEVSKVAKSLVETWKNVRDSVEKGLAHRSDRLNLPSKQMMGGVNFLLPGKKTIECMSGVITDQRKGMFIYTNAKGNRSNKQWPMGTTASYEPRWHGDGEKAMRWSIGELLANIFDVTSGTITGDYVFCVDQKTKAVSITQGDGEGFAGFAPTLKGFVAYNISHPFCANALLKDNNKRPKQATSTRPAAGTGCYNNGLKQAVQNCAAANTRLRFTFWGWDYGNANATYEYTWDTKAAIPYTLCLKQNSAGKASPEPCNVPILFQEVTWKEKPKNGQEFVSKLNGYVADVLATMERVYKFDAQAGVVIQAPNGIKVMHRSCFSLLLDQYADIPIVMPQGPLILVGERFYNVAFGANEVAPPEYVECLRNLIVSIPGRGVPKDHKGSPFVVFYDESRRITIHTVVSMISTMIVNIVVEAKRGNAAALTQRGVLSNQLRPLLFGSKSEIFGEARGKLVNDLLVNEGIKRIMDDLRNMLLREHLRKEHKEDTDEVFERKLGNGPLVTMGCRRRMAVLAHLCDTYSVLVDPKKVHWLLYKNTNPAAAEKRAAEVIHHGCKAAPALPKSLQRLADSIIGTNVKVAFLPLPDIPLLRLAAVPFRFDDDSSETHLAVAFQRDDVADQVQEICNLRESGNQIQMLRAAHVSDMRKDQQLSGLGLEEAIDKILDDLRAFSEPGKDDEKEIGEGTDDEYDPPIDHDDTTPQSPKNTPSKRGRYTFDIPQENVHQPGYDIDFDTGNDPHVRGAKRDKSDTESPSKRQRNLEPLKTEPAKRFVPQPGMDQTPNDNTDYLKFCEKQPESDIHREPDPEPGDKDFVKFLKQKPVTFSGYRIFVPWNTYDDNANVSAPSGFDSAYKMYFAARTKVVSLIGFGTAKVYPTWSPFADWRGMTYSAENLVLINIANPEILTPGRMQTTLLHELAHEKCGCHNQHNLKWSRTMEELHSALTDASSSC
tara:strand:+ start:143 stop:3175 length:3033 start_codon:yes stop_codon:yes gene_type:complete